MSELVDPPFRLLSVYIQYIYVTQPKKNGMNIRISGFMLKRYFSIWQVVWLAQWQDHVDYANNKSIL